MVMYKKIYKGEYRCPRWTSPELRHLISKMLDTNPDTRITIEEIVGHSWFRGEEIKFYHEFSDEDGDPKLSDGAESSNSNSFTAFDIISFSAGLDLSGMFDDSFDALEDRQRFLLPQNPAKIFEELDRFAEEERLTVKKMKGHGVELRGPGGDFRMGVEVYSLTDHLSVVEAKRRGSDGAAFRDVLKNKLMPFLSLRNRQQERRCTAATGS